MAEPEPNKKWDELLRAQARAPRPEIDLDPVTRRLLQEEVKKAYGAALARPSKLHAFSRWWIRWPLATAFVACAILLVVQNRRFEETKKPEDQKREPASSDLLSSAEAPRGQAFGGRMLAAPGAAPAARAENDAASGSVATRTERQGYALRDSAPPYFLNAQPEQSAALRAFRVEKQGSNVIVLDRDGSVYSGDVVEERGATVGGYVFRVQGTNQTAQQAVDFQGRLDFTTNAQTQVANARVTGAATVGTTNQVRVDAAQK